MADDPHDAAHREHVFLGHAHERNERRTRMVVVLTVLMMVGEIVAGSVYGSMALLADGWHMGTHAGALAISAWAYSFARRHARDPRFVFGTGKVGDLAGFASALVLALVALLIGWESCQRLLQPQAIRFDEAILVAVLGLLVNLGSAWMLGAEKHGHEHADHNLRSARLHVLTDALTSVLAIAALCAGRFLGWAWLDPAMGVVGALLILRWSWSLTRDSGAALLDFERDTALAEAIRARVEREGDRISDLHVWRVGPGHYSAIISLSSAQPRPAQHYKSLLADLPQLAHLSIEVEAATS